MADNRQVVEFDSSCMAWKNWKEKFLAYMNTFDSKHKKLSHLKHLGGDEVNYVLQHGRNFSDRGEINFTSAMKILDEHYASEENELVELDKFRKLKQFTHENVKKFLARLRQQAAKCGFNDPDAEVRRQFVLGTTDEKLRSKAFKKNLSLQDLIQTACANESQMNYTSQPSTSFEGNSTINLVRQRNNSAVVCFFCKKVGHYVRDCEEVKRHKCKNCGIVGHSEFRCRLKYQSVPRRQYRPQPYTVKKRQSFDLQPRVNLLEEVPEEQKVEETKQEYLFFMDGLDRVDCLIGGVKLRMVVDSGAVSNIISMAAWEILKAHNVKTQNQDANCSKKFRAYGADEPIEVAGTFEAEIQWKEQKLGAKFYVLKKGEHSLLGAVTAKALGIIQVNKDVSHN